MNQANIRKICLNLRKQISHATQQEASSIICQKIIQLSCYQTANSIALYTAIEREIDLRMLWEEAAAEHKKTYFPHMQTDKTLSFLPSNAAKNPSSKGFKSDSQSAIKISEIDLMVVPLVAFDLLGTRLGRGQGYYDKTLATQKPCFLLGVAYEFQKQPLIERNTWDVPLQAIITEKENYWFN